MRIPFVSNGRKWAFRLIIHASVSHSMKGLSQAVREVFVRLYEKGLIYRGKNIINWDPAARTALSDIEVEHKEVQRTSVSSAISA